MGQIYYCVGSGFRNSWKGRVPLGEIYLRLYQFVCFPWTNTIFHVYCVRLLKSFFSTIKIMSSRRWEENLPLEMAFNLLANSLRAKPLLNFSLCLIIPRTVWVGIQHILMQLNQTRLHNWRIWFLLLLFWDGLDKGKLGLHAGSEPFCISLSSSSWGYSLLSKENNWLDFKTPSDNPELPKLSFPQT